MGIPAKIICYNLDAQSDNGCSDFSLNAYWGNSFQSHIYICGDQGRSTFNDVIETTTDITGQNKRIQNTSIEVHNLSFIATSPLLALLKTIDKHDVKQIEYLDTGEIYDITNVDIDDQGDILSPVQNVYITFEGEPITKNSGTIATLDESKVAFWDNNDDGISNSNGEAQYDSVTDLAFNTWQLYYESDTVTPATSGNVVILAYAVSQQSSPSNPVESLVGVFEGEFTDLFSDSTKWQSSQQIWDYFNVADSVGHTNRMQFDKRAFAEDNGYYSSETEDRAVSIRFDLSIDGSSIENTTLSLVYGLLGAFHSAGVQDPVSSNYGYTTVGKVDEKNTLSTVIDSRLDLPSGALPATITAFVLSATTNYSNQYVLDVAPAGEYSYQGQMTTFGGYVGSNFRGAFGANNFTFGIDEASALIQELNILNFTIGTSPYIFTLDWKYDRVGTYAQLGDINVANGATIQLDTVTVNTPAIAKPSPVQVLGTQAFTLIDTQKHVVRFDCPTDGTYTIFQEFEVQIKPLF